MWYSYSIVLANPCGTGTYRHWPTRAVWVQSPLRPALGGPCGLGHCQAGWPMWYGYISLKGVEFEHTSSIALYAGKLRRPPSSPGIKDERTYEDRCLLGCQFAGQQTDIWLKIQPPSTSLSCWRSIASCQSTWMDHSATPVAFRRCTQFGGSYTEPRILMDSRNCIRSLPTLHQESTWTPSGPLSRWQQLCVAKESC
jgi:hypothetical protein